MNDLPEIDYQQTSKRMAEELGNLQFRYFQMENLAERLKVERDDAYSKLSAIEDAEKSVDKAGDN